MFQVYLPIAEMSVHMLVILALGGVTGVLSGMFGVGGGFLTTPFLIFLGVPPTVAVATSANQIVASSISGFLLHWRRQNVDFLMGNLLLLGGLLGSVLGIWLFRTLQAMGQIDLVISLAYVFFLGFIAITMGVESLRTLRGIRKPVTAGHILFHQRFAHWPWQLHFSRYNITISGWLPIGIGLMVGVLVSIMGIGGGFFMIPAMIYLLGLPTSMVVGTSLYQIIFVTANVTLLHATTTHTVDMMLAFLLILGSVVGAQIGTRLGARISGEKLRGMLALVVLLVTLRLAYGLFITPTDIYSLELLP